MHVIHSTRSCSEQAGDAHHHQADRAVAADVVLHAASRARASITSRFTGSRMITASSFMRSARRGVDPVAVPARRAELRQHRVRLVAALAGDDRIERRERLRRRSRRASGGVSPPIDGTLAADVRRREEHRLDRARSRAPPACATSAPSPTMPRQPTNPTRIVITFARRRPCAVRLPRSSARPRRSRGRSGGDATVRSSWRRFLAARATSAAAAGDCSGGARAMRRS